MSNIEPEWRVAGIPFRVVRGDGRIEILRSRTPVCTEKEGVALCSESIHWNRENDGCTDIVSNQKADNTGDKIEEEVKSSKGIRKIRMKGKEKTLARKMVGRNMGDMFAMIICHLSRTHPSTSKCSDGSSRVFRCSRPMEREGFRSGRSNLDAKTIYTIARHMMMEENHPLRSIP